MKIHLRLCLIFSAAVSLLCVIPLHAQFVAVGINDGFWNSSGGRGVFGWSFTTNATLKINSLGLYDVLAPVNGRAAGDGLAGSHQIGIWDLADHSSPLVTTSIPSGSVAELVDGFRYVDIAPLVLAAGHQYAIAALYHNDDDFLGQLNNPALIFTPGPGIDLGDYQFARGATQLVFPDSSEPGPVSGFGPNFTYSLLSPVPEPSTYGAIGALSLVGVIALRRFKGKKMLASV